LKRIFGLQENTERIFKGKIYSFSNSEDLKRRYTYRYFKYQAKIWNKGLRVFSRDWGKEEIQCYSKSYVNIVFRFNICKHFVKNTDSWGKRGNAI